ncbi:MAG: DUF2075 domain-containing protein [Clostridia bacterium]|nr:DUF2075 domain-containing protein [Clostridia bacterium]
MAEYIFSNKTGKAYYYNSIDKFLYDAPDNILGSLVKHSFEINIAQSDAWMKQIKGLQEKLKSHGISGDIIFEYDIVRLGKRIDVILLIRNMVFSLEFKNGKKAFEAKDAQQAEDYAIDIKNFHKESEDLYVCPILVATDAPDYPKIQSIDAYADKQIRLQRENISTFAKKISDVSQKYGEDKQLDFNKWFNSPYYPTPTIIAAAVEAYSSHDISEIAKSEAGQQNVELCEEKINKIIDYSKNNKKKCICFVTGVPGAGKTLVGLDVVSKNLEKGGNALSVYLSGNGPLVAVLRRALLNSAKEQKKYKKFETEAAINALIQGSYEFKRDNYLNNAPTPEKILIFDEAQRVWNKQKMTEKHKDDGFAVSEPYFLYSVMDRQEDWAVIICLVGLGQDIYDGEVGINEWFKTGIEDFKNWEIFYSEEIFNQIEDKNINIDMIKSCKRCHSVDGLHLKTSIRSFRADKQSKFVDALLDNNPEEAKKYYEEIIQKYPLYITRNYNKAKAWVKAQVRGSQRCGVLASSGAQRLKPEGIYVPMDIDVENWFLAPSSDLRSSNMLEVVASEFKVQGLEIDWALVCWDADLRRMNDDWAYFIFRGAKWFHRNKEEQRRYLLNSYRVLLTRARQGMVIFVPKGVDEEEDDTRNHFYYDYIYKYLLKCGIKELDEEK